MNFIKVNAVDHRIYHINPATISSIYQDNKRVVLRLIGRESPVEFYTDLPNYDLVRKIAIFESGSPSGSILDLTNGS